MKLSEYYLNEDYPGVVFECLGHPLEVTINHHGDVIREEEDTEQAIIRMLGDSQEFVYYIEMLPNGWRSLKGIKVGAEESFLVDSAVGDFYIETCDDRMTSYLVVLDGSEMEEFYVYDLEGQSVELPDMPTHIDDLRDAICH